LILIRNTESECCLSPVGLVWRFTGKENYKIIPTTSLSKYHSSEKIASCTGSQP